MDEKLDISLEFERIYDELAELSKWSDLADDTLGLLIVLMQENYKLQQEIKWLIKIKNYLKSWKSEIKT